MNDAIIFFAGALLLAGCGQSGATPVQPPMPWQTLADGSRFAISPAGPGKVAGDAARCWPVPNGFSCLSLSEFGELGFSAQRFDAAALPGRFPIEATPAGYSCSFAPRQGLFQEEIGSTAARLSSNAAITGGGRPWSRAWAEQFLRDNRVDGAPYFDCRSLLAQIAKGGLATLGTTAITRAHLR